MTDETPLKSAKAVDYSKLEILLQEGKWSEADRETAEKMLEVANRQQEGWLDVKDIDNFPCEDLRIIDQLWLKYSNGHFGLSVQQKIYGELGGSKEYNDVVWQKFCDQVGWRDINSDEIPINFQKWLEPIIDKPKAHFPSWRCCQVHSIRWFRSVYERGLYTCSLLSRELP